MPIMCVPIVRPAIEYLNETTAVPIFHGKNMNGNINRELTVKNIMRVNIMTHRTVIIGILMLASVYY